MTEEPLKNKEITFKELIQELRIWIDYLKTKWIKIAIACILGGAVGYLYAFLQPITYTAKTTFVVEEAKSGGSLSSLASLAGQFGVDLGSNAGGGLITGDNILLYFKSESLIREVLLSPWDSKLSIADKYLELNGLKKSWEKDSTWKTFKIPVKEKNISYTRKQDSLLQLVVKNIIKTELQISRVDKKAGFLELSSTMIDEELSKRFNDQLVKSAVDQYVSLKTERQKKTVQKLQQRADSIARLLNVRTSISASLQTKMSTMDVNPIFKTSSSISAEVTSRDKTMLGAIYVEVVKNLEMAKFTLSQETPVIQIVNSPLYPLIKSKQSKLKSGLLVGFLFSTITILVLTLKRWLNMQVVTF